MAQHNEIGRTAEQLAADFLISRGYVLRDRNYRHKHAEIDLVMEYKGILVFVEVKFRSGTGYGYAEEFVDYRKRQLIIRAADHYLYEKDWHKDIRFDIVGVYRDKEGVFRFKQFEDAFY